MSSPFLIVAALLVSFQGAATKEDGWKTAKAEDGSFSVELPAEFKVLKQNPPGPNGPTDQLVYYCKLDGALYTAQAIRGVEAPAAGKEIARLKVEQQAYTSTPGVKILKSEEIKVGQNPALDFTTEGPSPRGTGRVTSRTRIFFANGIYYSLTTMSKLDQPLPKQTDRFLESFKLEEPAAKPTKPGGKRESVGPQDLDPK